jgi:hypothetical protein
MGFSRGGKDTTASYRQIDVRWLQRNGYIRPFCERNMHWSVDGQQTAWIRVRVEQDRITLIYRHRSNGGPWEPVEYPIFLEWTACHYGGRRPWFRCPGSGCGRRVALLYGGTIFACRHCHRLAYETQHESPSGRALLKAQNIRVKLGGSGSLAEPLPRRPRGMHRKTYLRLLCKAECAAKRSWSPGLLKKLGLSL